MAAKALLVFLPLEKLATSKFTSPADQVSCSDMQATRTITKYVLTSLCCQVAAEYLTLNLGRPQLSSPSPSWSERTTSLLG